jgi:hypothetical protein
MLADDPAVAPVSPTPAAHNAAPPRDDDQLEAARVRMANNEALLSRLESLVELLWAQGKAEGAVAWAATAAHFAAQNHPGRFHSPRLERVLASIGRAAVPAPPPRERDSGAGRVLHVLTEAYPTGGHTRLCWRWIQLDASRRHSVALTSPGSSVPPPLEAAASASGGTLTRLTAGPQIEQARALRALADEFDAVVLHHHMFDPIPAVAFADRQNGPMILVEDHADHLFWLGTGVVDVLVNNRTPGLELAYTRRGIEAERCRILPIPYGVPERRYTRQNAKAMLGLSAETRVMLTVAMPHKFMPVVAPGFLDVVEPVLHAHPDAVLLAVGPKSEGEWRAAAERTAGRLRPLGLQVDISVYLHAADVYVDSYPFSSNTSLIEGAGHGAPVMSFSPNPERQGLLLSSDPGIEHLIVRADTPAGYARALGALLADPVACIALGERSAAGIADTHAGPGWQARLEACYAVAGELGPRPLLPPARAAEPATDFEAIHTLLFLADGQSPPLETLVASHAPSIPADCWPTGLPDRPLAAPRWGLLGPVPADLAQLRATIDCLAVLERERQFDYVAMTVAPADLDAVVPAIERELAAWPELDIDLMPTDDPVALLELGRVVVAAPDAPLAAAARLRGLAVVAP